MPVRAVSLLLAVAAAPSASAADAHPVVKVVDLLKKLSAQAVAEGRTEEASFSKFQYWCKTSTADLGSAITEEKATIDELGSSIDGYKQESTALTGQVKELEGEILSMQASAKTADDKDKARTKLYTTTKTDIKATIKSLDDAVKALSEASKTDSKLLQEGAQTSIRQALALLATKATDAQRSVLVDFVAASADPKATGDLKTHTKKYSFKSDNVIDLLKELNLKFQDDLTTADTEETAAANAFALEKQARDASEAAGTKSKNQKGASLTDTQGSLAEAEGSQKDQKEDLAADSKTLSTTNQACASKSREWEERSKTRSHEIEAIGMAVKILGKVTGVQTEAPANPVLPNSPVKFLQVVDPKARAVQLLRATAQVTHSKALERLALEVSTHLTGPFDKVNGMVQKMIFRLMSEQTNEDKHKAWCDIELEKSATSTSDKQDKIKEIVAKIDESTAKVAALTGDITDADKMVADITAYMAEATEIRTAGKHENTVAVKDAKSAQVAIANAVAVMQDFYKAAGAALVQKSSAPVKLPDDPKLWDSSYSPVADTKDPKTAVVSILEKIAVDFSKMEAETKAQEVTDQKKFDEQMTAHKVEKARRTQESEMKLQEKKRKVSKITALTSTKKNTNSELDAVKQYSKDLQPACVQGDSTFADRKAARAQEIKALKDAQVMLQEAFKEKPASKFLQVRSHSNLA